MIRIGANVKLIKQLGYAREYDHIVYLWPGKVAKKKMSPLVLRLIVIHVGKQPVYLVTSVLSKQRLSAQQTIEIYRDRWGIELFFRPFNQTFGRTKLRSRSAENAKLELDWSLVALWSICLLGQRELVRAGEAPLAVESRRRHCNFSRCFAISGQGGRAREKHCVSAAGWLRRFVCFFASRRRI